MNKRELINKFAEIAVCEPEIAYYYLMEKNWNFTRALGLYFSKQEGGSDGSDVEPAKKRILDESARKALKEEMEEIWEEPKTKVKNARLKSDVPFEDLRNNLPASYLVGENPLVSKVQKRLQERFIKQEEEIFEI